MIKPRLIGRKLLVASVGVAAVSYVACSTQETSGNLMVADPTDAAQLEDSGDDQDAFIGSGNLVPPASDASDRKDASDLKDAADEDAFIGSGNLVPPQPDAGQ